MADATELMEALAEIASRRDEGGCLVLAPTLTAALLHLPPSAALQRAIAAVTGAGSRSHPSDGGSNHSGTVPRPLLLHEGAAVRMAVLRALSQLVARNEQVGAPEKAGASASSALSAAALLQLYREQVAWPLLLAGGAGQHEVCRCVCRLAAAARGNGGVHTEDVGTGHSSSRAVAAPSLGGAEALELLQRACLASIEGRVQALRGEVGGASSPPLHGGALGGGDHMEAAGGGGGGRRLPVEGACHLGAALCGGGVWCEAFSPRLLAAVLELLLLESKPRTHGYEGVAVGDGGDGEPTRAEPLPPHGGGSPDDDDDDEAAPQAMSEPSVASLCLGQILPGLVACAPPSERSGGADGGGAGRVWSALWEAVQRGLADGDDTGATGGGRNVGLALGCRFHSLLFGQDLRLPRRASSASKVAGDGDGTEPEEEEVVALSPSRDVRDDGARFWEPLRRCLLDPRSTVRQQALALLRHATAAAQPPQDGGGGRTRSWHTFCMIAETLEQRAVHLLEGLWWADLPAFCAEQQGGQGGLENGPPPPPPLRGPLCTHPGLARRAWLGVLFRRGLASENKDVRQLVLWSVLDGAVYGRGHGLIEPSLICEALLPAIEEPWLYHLRNISYGYRNPGLTEIYLRL
jgi:hypothetical protein